jgi:sugar lactone lactonase YvrE
MLTDIATAEPRIVSHTRDRVGECPVWDVATQSLYWVDIEGCQIRRWVAETGTQTSWTTPERVGCIALAPGGRLLAAMETGIFLVTPGAAPHLQVERLVAIAHPMTGMRFNDGRCDRQGRFWVTTLCMDMTRAAQVGGLYCFDGRTFRGPVLSELITPNGMAFNEDGCTAYLSDSHPSVQQVWRFDFDPVKGEFANPRVFVDMLPLPGRPDGAAVDAEGHYWICANDSGLVHRFSPQGQLVQSVALPVPKPSMCAFGGADLCTLFVTSIRPANAPPAELQRSGAVFALDVGVRGLPEPVFAGALLPIS